jgi:hypothetical protein
MYSANTCATMLIIAATDCVKTDETLKILFFDEGKEFVQEAPPRFELGFLDSKSKVVTTGLRGRKSRSRGNPLAVQELQHLKLVWLLYSTFLSPEVHKCSSQTIAAAKSDITTMERASATSPTEVSVL